MLARRLHTKWALRERMADKRTVSVLGNRVRTTTSDLVMRKIRGGIRHAASSAFKVARYWRALSPGTCTEQRAASDQVRRVCRSISPGERRFLLTRLHETEVGDIAEP